MIVGVQGTPSFKNYNIFLRAMAVALSELKEDESLLNYLGLALNGLKKT